MSNVPEEAYQRDTNTSSCRRLVSRRIVVNAQAERAVCIEEELSGNLAWGRDILGTSRSQSPACARGCKPQHLTPTCNNSMGLESLLATVGTIFTLALSVVAEPATLPFTDCFGGNATYKLNISTVYGQTLSDRYLNLTIIGNAPIEIISANNNTSEPVASA